jgi:hypothetical protein
VAQLGPLCSWCGGPTENDAEVEARRRRRLEELIAQMPSDLQVREDPRNRNEAHVYARPGRVLVVHNAVTGEVTGRYVVS